MNYRPTPLGDRYRAEIDAVDRYEWYKIIDEFGDANLYQTWDYDSVRCGDKKISHLVLRSDEKIISAAQARIVRIPIIGWGAAYIRWGPLWQLRNQIPDIKILRLMFRALRNEYVCRRGLILRIFPLLYENNTHSYKDILAQESYAPVPEENRGRTLIMDLDQPLDDIRKKLDQKWRNCLNKSERNNLEVIEGNDDRLFSEFIALYHELLKRKKFEEPNDINEFRAIQRHLPDEWKMRIFLCRNNGVNSAGIICATVGEAGVYLFGATNDQGMADKGSYLAQWKVIQWMKNKGCKYYNLNGINPIKNPGSYHFKAGLSGKSGQDVHYLGRFDSNPGPTIAALARVYDLVFSSTKIKKKSQIKSNCRNT